MNTHWRTQRRTFRKEWTTRLVSTVLISVVLWPIQGHATDRTHEQLYAMTAPGVVFVYGRSGQNGSVGSGSIVRADGSVLTNAHVVLEKKTGSPHDVIWVALKPDATSGDVDEDLKNRFPAVVQAYHQELDLALLKVTKPLPAVTVLKLGDSDHVKIGARVIAIGHPEQGGLWTLTTGVISTFRANHGKVQGKHMFQTETSMNRGNSGGPLINGDGHQIGVNTSIARRAKDGLTITDVNFSLRSNVAVAWMADQGVSVETAQGSRESDESDFPTVKEPPEAVTLPPERPYRFSQIDRWFERMQQDLEDVADEMRTRIRAKRDRDARKSVGQTRTVPPSRPGTARAPTSMRQSEQETRRTTKLQDTARVGEPPDHQLDCRVYDTQTLDITFGLKAGNFLFSFGPEMGLEFRSGVVWKQAAQRLIARYVELCNRYNAGMVTKAEYEARLERIEALYKEAQQLQEQWKAAVRRRSRSAFDELNRETGNIRGNQPARTTDLENKVEQLTERIERLTPVGQPLEPS